MKILCILLGIILISLMFITACGERTVPYTSEIRASAKESEVVKSTPTAEGEIPISEEIDIVSEDEVNMDELI